MKKQTLRYVWALVVRFPNFGTSDSCVWRTQLLEFPWTNNEDNFSIKIAALQCLQATESFVKIHENANLQPVVPIAIC